MENLENQKAALFSIYSYTALITFKIIAGLVMNSISVISEAIHSGIDLMASFVAYFSIKKASQPRDDDHPFGHGKFENVSGAFEAILIFFAAGLIIYEAIKKIISIPELKSIEAGIGVMLISAIVNIFISRTLFKVSKKSDSIALEADAWHLLTDVYTSAGVMVGLIIIKITNFEIIDPIIAMIVAAMIIKASIDLTRKTLGGLVDESLPKHEIQTIVDIIKQHSAILNYHKLRTRKSGNIREIDIHVIVNKENSLTDVHNLCYDIENHIKNAFPGSYVTIHIEPEEE
jgi:cation diffusion facilitator family transporter